MLVSDLETLRELSEEELVVEGGIGTANMEVYRNDLYNDKLGSFNSGGKARLSSNANDQISSIFIVEGKWQFCTDANYKGQCRTLNPGFYYNPSQFKLPNDSISSFRRVG